MYGSLLHDIGKIIYRSNDHAFARGTHSKLGHKFLSQFSEFKDNELIDSVAYHHYKELAKANLANDNTAYITYIADNIASGIDRRDIIEEGDEEYENNHLILISIHLYSVFNIVNSEKLKQTSGKFKFSNESNIEYPKTENIQYSSGNYTALMKDMSYDLEHKLSIKEDTFPSLLQWTESLWQYVPSSTNKNQLIDISLYDHSRITCAIASCIFDYLNENNIHNYKDELFTKYENTKAFYQKAFYYLVWI